ncbi:MAG: FdtA/QdtA family cupin domain-containing protein [bacterium]
MINSTVSQCRTINLPKIHNLAGNITSLNSPESLPFDIKRVYYLYDIPGGESRGGHAHKNLYQLITAASGSFEVIIDDGKSKKSIILNHPYNGLLIVPGIWRELENFSSGAICLVLASQLFNEEDYIRKHDEFLFYKANISD